MSEFHRMITYLYLYEHGKKRHNVGFAKIEKRDSQCRIEIHMKNTGHSIPSTPVYFYARNNQKLPGILLGTIGLSRGNGDFKAILKEESLSDSSYSLEDIKGIFIPLSDDIMFVSQWDDHEFVRDNFVDPAKEAPARKKPETKSQQDASVQKIPSQQDASVQRNPSQQNVAASRNVPTQNASASRNISPQNASASRNVPTQNASASRNISPQNASASRNVPTQNVSANRNASPQNVRTDRGISSLQDTPPSSAPSATAMPAPASSADLKAAEAVPKQMPCMNKNNPSPAPPEEKQESLPENWEQKWKFILENYPVMTPFAGDENTVCVRLELKDIRLLPKPYWYLGNNSFLLHGFFNYRYLILGALEKSGRKRWFIGIPGVYQNPERVMATLFGFPEFRNEKSVPVNTGEFGYWYRYLN